MKGLTAYREGQKPWRMVMLIALCVLVFLCNILSLNYVNARDISRTDSTKPVMTVTENSTIITDAGTTPKIPPSSSLLTDRVAVMVETRRLDGLVPLLLHFAAVLGPGWPVIVYTIPGLTNELTNVPAFIRMAHQIEIRALPEGTQFSTREDASRFLTQSWLWDSLAPAEHVLIFQADSMICGNAVHTIDDFLEYDFVGAPIAEGFGRGYNGGLSLRRRSSMLQVIKQHNWEEQSKTFRQGHTDGYNLGFEDQWFIYQLLQMVHHKLPPEEVAMRFAVETVWYDKPLGYHQPYRYFGGRKNEIEKWCPEVRMTVGGIPE